MKISFTIADISFSQISNLKSKLHIVYIHRFRHYLHYGSPTRRHPGSKVREFDCSQLPSEQIPEPSSLLHERRSAAPNGLALLELSVLPPQICPRGRRHDGSHRGHYEVDQECDSVHHRGSWGTDLLLRVLQTTLMSAIAEARFMAGWIRLPATQERRTVEPE